MTDNVIKLLRASVRPVVTIGLGIAFCVACFVDSDAAKMIGPVFGGAMGFWFNGRTKQGA